jgi:hypothetical protein
MRRFLRLFVLGGVLGIPMGVIWATIELHLETRERLERAELAILYVLEWQQERPALAELCEKQHATFDAYMQACATYSRLRGRP